MNTMGRFGRFGNPSQGWNFATPTNLNRELVDIWFCYDFSFGNVTTGQTVTQILPTQADANFLWEESSFYGTENGATEPVNETIQFPFTLQLTDSGTGRAFFAGSAGAASVPVGSVTGTGRFPYILPQPYLIRAVSSMQAVLTSLSPNTWNNCHLTLIGKKTYASYPLNGPAIS